MTTSREILKYWFEGVDDQTIINKSAMPFRKWFVRDLKLDQDIRAKFEGDWEAASRGEHKDWEADSLSRLALIVLFDQFSRNMFRDTPKMYTTDALALDLSLRSIKDGTEDRLQLIERVFLYMPLMHSEDLSVQKVSVDRFSHLVALAKKHNPVNVFYYEYNLKYADQHYKFIERFGRFPHRNAILQRSSTPEEIEFLKNPRSAF